MPIQKDLKVQQFVRKILYRQPIETQAFSHQLGKELHHLNEQRGMKDIQKKILTNRVGGNG